MDVLSVLSKLNITFDLNVTAFASLVSFQFDFYSLNNELQFFYKILSVSQY